MKAVLLVSLLYLFSTMLYASNHDQLMVKFSDINAQYQIVEDIPAGETLALLSPQLNARGMAVFRWQGTTSEQLKLKQMDVLRKHPAVKWVERDSTVVSPQFIPNDPLLTSQNHWQAPISLFQAWDTHTDCSGVVVAVIDSGIDPNHPDLQDHLFINPQELPDSSNDNDSNGYIGDYRGWNAITDNGDVLDLFGHGTHVAGIIGAIANNNAGVAGVCWKVQLLPVKFLNRFGDGSISNAVKAIHYVIDVQAQFPEYRFIINNSWAANVSTALVDALNAATEAGILLVNAAGNLSRDLDKQAQQPAAFSAQNLSSITVANANTRDYAQDFTLHNSSNYGLQSVTLAAPGVDIFSTWLSSADIAYRTQTGTSMAAPIISGIAALLWSLQPDLSASQLRAILEAATGESSAMIGRIKQAGIVNAAQAISSTLDKPPLLAYIFQDEFVELKGEYLGNIESLTLENESLAFNVLSDQLLRLQEPEKLRCGTLYAQAPNSSVSKLYLDWLPETPELTSLQWLNAEDAILSWRAGAVIDRVEIQSALEDGQFSTLLFVDNAQQFTRLNALAPNSRLRIRGISQCKDIQGKPRDVSSAFSSVLNLTELNAPVWKTYAISEAKVNQLYSVHLNATDADSYSLQTAENDECFPLGLTLTQQGEIEGIASEAVDCTFRVAAVSELNQQQSIRRFKMIVSKAEATEQQELALYAIDEDGVDHVALMLNFSAIDIPIKGATLELDENVRTLNWGQSDSTPLYELALEYIDNGQFSSLSWLKQDQLAQTFTGNVQNNYASFIVDKENAYVFDGLQSRHQFRLAFNITQQNQLNTEQRSDRRCFIATSIYGNADHEHVKKLRLFRDMLLNNWPSLQPLVDFYYQHSPRWVAYMEENPKLNKFLQTVLKPLIELGIDIEAWWFTEKSQKR